MPRILDLKTDEQGNVWCNLGRITTETGTVTILSNEEINMIKRHERQRVADIMIHAVTNLDAHEELLYAKSC